jgi:Flp pilus assembly protein TadG
MALEIWTRFRSFCSDRAGSFAPTFALLLVPVVGLIGAALDYSRAANERVMLQRALDTALLAAAQDGTSNWPAVAEGTFRSAYQPKAATPPARASRPQTTPIRGRPPRPCGRLS